MWILGVENYRSSECSEWESCFVADGPEVRFCFVTDTVFRIMAFSPLCRFAPGLFVPWLVCPLADSPPGSFAPWLVRPLADSLLVPG